MDRTACLSESTLDDLVNGRLGVEPISRLHEHASTCPACFDLVAELMRQQDGGGAPMWLTLSRTLERGVGDTLIGQRIGSYRLVRELGRGGMGVVYEAVHDTLGGRAAVKVLSAELSQEAEYVQRLFNEARAVSQVQHPGLVQIFDFGKREDGSAYVLMEYLEGEPLLEMLGRLTLSTTPMPPRQAASLARQMATTLSAVHDLGIVHRDLKPGNMMLVPDPILPYGLRVKLLDFGIAKVRNLDRRGGGAHGPLTTAGRFLGTPLYMSPEQCQESSSVDGKADVYSLGVILYEMLAGRTPFLATSAASLVAMHLMQPPPPLGTVRPGLPAPLTALVDEMLRKDPQQRPSARAVAERLADVESEPLEGVYAAPSSRPQKKKWWALAAALPLAAGGYLVTARMAAPVMVLIPGGTFQMGSSNEEIEAAYGECRANVGADCVRATYEREQPQRMVQISTFRIDRNEVTNGAFVDWLNGHRGLTVRRDIVVDGDTLLLDLRGNPEIAHDGRRFRVAKGAASRPVTRLTWFAARNYCAAQGKRLPTEAEWEFAARGARRLPFPWGDEPPRCDGVVFGRDSGQACAHLGQGPAAVGTSSQDRTPLGAEDLAGNVSEWVLDRFHESYPLCKESPCADPRASEDAVEEAGKGGAVMRVFRGGDWVRPASSCRTAARSRRAPREWAQNIGFRCAASGER